METFPFQRQDLSARCHDLASTALPEMHPFQGLNFFFPNEFLFSKYSHTLEQLFGKCKFACYDSDIQIVEETTMTQENDRRNRAEQMASIIRQNLKRAITRQGVSQQEVARKAGMNPASFSQMLNGNKRLLFEDMYAVCDVLGLNIADLMDATSLQNEMQQKVEALLKQANQLTDQANNLKQQAVTLQHADALGNQAKGALVGVGSPRFLVSPFNPDAPIEGGISGAAKGALAGFVPYGVPSGSGSPSSPSKHGGIGVSGRSQAHETLRNMTTIIMHTSDDNRGQLFLALFQGFPFLGNLPITLVFHEAPTGTQE